MEDGTQRQPGAEQERPYPMADVRRVARSAVRTGRTAASSKITVCSSCWVRSATPEACMLREKTIGKPCAGNPHARFERGPQVLGPRAIRSPNT